jgi:hypothetical protein
MIKVGGLRQHSECARLARLVWPLTSWWQWFAGGWPHYVAKQVRGSYALMAAIAGRLLAAPLEWVGATPGEDPEC